MGLQTGHVVLELNQYFENKKRIPVLKVSNERESFGTRQGEVLIYRGQGKRILNGGLSACLPLFFNI